MSGAGKQLSGKVAVFYDPIYLGHDTGMHPESPGRLRHAVSHLKSSSINERLLWMPPRQAEDSEILLAHLPQHLETVRVLSARGGGRIDLDTSVYPDSYQVAAWAVGGAIAAAEWAWQRGPGSFAVALVRPPGHHASSGSAGGFCLFNNVAVGARYLQRQGAERVLIVDWDLHHGNGTQEIFYSDPSVLYFSIHQHPAYPGTGSPEEIGRGPGRGYTVNFPVPPGTGDDDLAWIMSSVLMRLAAAFRPHAIAVSCGFDGYFADPLGDLRLTVEGFGRLAAGIRDLAFQQQAPVFAVLEGGYHRDGIARGLERVLAVWSGSPAELAPPTEPGAWVSRVMAMIRQHLADRWEVLADRGQLDI